jgi:hypothetical protein
MSTSSPHPDDSVLIAAIDRELTASRQAAIDAHLRDCALCRVRAAELLTASNDVRSLARDNHDTARHHRARARLLDALRHDAAGEARPPAESLLHRTSTLQWLAALATVATLLLMFVAPRVRSPQPADASRDTPAGVLPITTLTPGSIAPLTASQLCSGQRPVNVVPVDVERRVLKAYKMENVPAQDYEMDALITPELGGTSDAANVWPQRYGGGVWNARVKDEIEDYLRDAVCRGDLELQTAQHDLANNWVAAYRKYLHRTMPGPSASHIVDGLAVALLTPADATRDGLASRY